MDVLPFELNVGPGPARPHHHGFLRLIASVRELILHVYGKNKQDIKSLKIVVERSDWYQKFSFFM